MFSGVYDFCGLPIMASRWAPTSYKRSYYNPCEWPYKWVTGCNWGYFTPINGVITLLLVGVHLEEVFF